MASDLPLRGILLVIASTVFFAISDVGAKLMTQTMSPLMVAWLRYVTSLLLVVPMAWAVGGTSMFVTDRPGLQVLRGLAMAASSILFITGMTYLPVAEMTAINFVSPVFITALSVLMLGERVGPRRWAAAVVGLVGVTIILRPGTHAFQWVALFPIASSAAWAFAAVGTRIMAGSNRPETTLIYSTVVPLVVLTAALPYSFRPFGMTELWLGIFVGVTSSVGHWFVVRAYRAAQASTIAPFVYLQLLWVTVLGYGLFGNLPDVWTYVGAAVIAASGLYTAHRERVRSRLR